MAAQTFQGFKNSNTWSLNVTLQHNSDKYFEIVQWAKETDSLEVLSEQIRNKYRYLVNSLTDSWSTGKVDWMEIAEEFQEYLKTP